MMSNSKIQTLIFASVFLTACGGGSDSNTSESIATATPVAIAANPASNANATNQTQYPEYETTAALVASNQFLLEGEYSLTIKYKPIVHKNVYVSVCADFEVIDEKFDIDYQSCMLRVSTNSEHEANIMVANDKQQLVMAIWSIEDIDNPRYEVWNNNNKSNNKLFVVN